MSVGSSNLGFILVLLALILGAPAQSIACEGELEWESVPLIGAIEVKYAECTEVSEALPTPLLRQTLRIRVRDGLPNTTYDVVIKGSPIATMRTDGRGEAELMIQRSGVRFGEDGRPLGNKRIDDGDLCEVFVLSDYYAAVFELI